MLMMIHGHVAAPGARGGGNIWAERIDGERSRLLEETQAAKTHPLFQHGNEGFEYLPKKGPVACGRRHAHAGASASPYERDSCAVQIPTCLDAAHAAARMATLHARRKRLHKPWLRSFMHAKRRASALV